MGLIKGLFTLNTHRALNKKERGIYEAIKEQPDLVSTSKKLATRSIVFSILSLLSVVSIVILASIWIHGLEDATNFFSATAIIIIAMFILLIMFLLFYAKAIYSLKYQLLLNKCRRAKVALALIIFPTILLVGGLIISFSIAKQNGAA